jgi:hypothetical protein
LLELVEDITEMEDDGSIKIEREICWYMSFFVIHLGEGNDCGDAVVDLERPLGKKASRKRKSIDCREKEIVMEVLNGLTEVNKRSHEERERD